MQNFLQVNRALAAEKNLNYFNLNQIKSNPDGEPTVNRQSRLMSYRCYLRNLAMIFAILALSIANIGMAWGESVTATYSHSGSSFNPVAFTTNDYFSAMTIATNGTVGGGTKTGARCNLNANTNTTITFTYTAKSSFEVTSFNLNSFVNSNDVKNSVITYYKNSETPTELSPAITFDKSDSSPSDKSSSTISESLNNGDVFTIKVSINNSTSTARQWYINTITLYLTASPSCTARTFKSGEKIFFKDASGSISGISDFWKSSNNIYAYFYDSNDGAEAVWSTFGNCVTGSWNVANAIYEFTVPQYNSADHTWTGVIFTRGSGAEWGSTTHQTSDQQPCVDQNMYIQNTSAAVDGKYNGSWGVYSNGPAIVGGMNNWLPDGGVLNFSGSTGTVIMNLEGSTSYEFKILEGTTWFGNNGTITSSIESGSSWTFTTDQNNCKITTGEAGEYVFKWDNTNKKLWVSYPGDRLRKNTYLYFDASNSTNWQSAEFDTKFYFVYYDTNDGVETKFGDDRISDTSYPWVFYTTVPDNDYVGKVQIVRMKDGDHSTQWNYANMTNANTRSSALQNCVYITEAQADFVNTQTLQWKTYCPPMSSATLNDNSTTVIAGTSGNGSVGNPYIVPTSGTIKVQAAATSAVPDPAMTKMFDFKVDNNSQQNSTATTYSKGSLSNNTVYQISVDAYNTYNETNGTKKTPDMLFYKALNQYSVTIEKTGVTKSSGAEGSNAVVHTYANYVAVFAASSGYTLPATVTVMRGGSDITANCVWDQGIGTLTIPADQITGNITITVTGVATTTITIDANTSNHGSTAPSPITATYGSALPSFKPAAGIGGWNLTGYFTEAIGGTKVINADGTLVASTDYADGDGNWKYETATLTLYAQYEEETPAPAGDCGEIIRSTFCGTKNSAVSTTTFTTTGTIGGTSTSCQIGTNGKLNTDGAYLILKLSTGTFLKGDTIKISSDKSGGVKFATGTVSTHTYTLIGTASTATSGGQPYYFVLAANADSIIVPRGAKNSDYNQNPAIANVSVHRPCPECDATPSAPTSPMNGATTSNSQAVSWTDASNDAWEVYVSTSSSTPAVDQTPTAEPTSASYTFTGLTASTTYYWWVRSVCDDTHKSSWVAGSSFETSPAAATPILSWALATNSSSWTATPTNNDETNLTDVATSTKHAAIQSGATSGKTCKISLSSSATPDKYVTFTFKVACGKKLTPSSVWMEVANVGGSSDGKMTHKAELSDIYGHTISATVVPASDGVLNELNITNGGGTYFQGEVTLKVWAWNSTSGGDGSAFRMGPNVKIFGEVADQASPAATITWNTQPANGQVGDPDFAYDVTCSDGSAVTVTSANTTYATIVGGKLHYAAAGTTHLVATATDACGNKVVQNSDDFIVSAAAPAGDCITIAYFETAQHSNSDNKPDKAGKYLYGYTNSAKTEAYAYTLTTGSTNNKGQGSGASDYLRVDNGTTINIYADKTTTGGTPANFSNVTSVSVDFKMKNSSYYTSFDIYVGDTKIADNVSLSGDAQTAFTTFTYNNLEQLNGKISIVNKGSGSTNFNFYIDNIEICTSNLPACTPPVLPNLTTKTVCEGGDADAAWDATITNSGSLVSGETVAYSWVKKGGSTPVSSVATYQPTSVTEAMAGTYVVTATVSADGKASKSATKEVTLTVNEATEVTAIKADKATVYPTNSVTLTATANVTPNSWQWYTCTNAEGAGEAIISGATSASYTIANARDAGTYYYKVKATGSCGTAARVYTLVVSPAVGGDCFHYVSVLPDKDISPSSGASIVTPTYATTLEGGTMNVGSSQVTITKNGLKLENSKYVSITLDAALEAGNVVIVKGSTATAGNGVTINGVNFYESGSKTFEVSYTVTADDGLVGKTALTVTKYSGSSYLQEIKITGCGAACTDPEVTASVDNSTACVGSSVTFKATGAHAEATYQWQKYSGGAWTDIADADAATYNIPSVATTDAMKYRVIATHDCGRTSNEVTLSVPVAPVFNSFTATRTVMATLALSITDVEASDATSYAWYKSADDTYDAGTDTKVGTAKELLLASGGEAADDTYYLFCVASNACGTTTSTAITVNVTAFIEEDCATKGNEGAADFGFTKENGVGESSVSSQSCWTSGGKAKYLTYTAPEGKYFDNAKVTVAVSSGSVAAYGYSTDGSSYTYANLTGLSSALAEKTIDLPANVTHFRIGRNFDPSYGVTSGTFYLSKICFEYSNACTATTVTPSETSKTYGMDGSSFTEPTFTVKHGETTFDPQPTLTYSSSNEDIASVDESGNVTFNDKAGTVTITAAYAGNATYCASEGSYTITVSCPDGAPKIVAANGTNMSGCNSSVTLNAKTQNDTDFADGTYQWFRNGKEISGATSSSYTATQTGVYTVEYTSAGRCTSLSTNSATVTSETVEPEVERLVPFQYYHVDKTYSAQMKDRHLFSVKGSAANGSTGRNFKLTMSRSGGEAVDMTTAASIFVKKSGDGQVDTVMIDLNKLSGKYNAGDELVLTCAAVDCNGYASDVYKNTITIHVIGATPTLALICSGSSKAGGTRKTDELTVGGDFLTGYNKADLCQQTDNQTFDANTEWGLYTRLKENYIVKPVNGYAVFNKLNYEPFDILLLTDYPKASKSPAAATVLDDMADLCDYRPMLSFKAHMVAKSPSKWAAKGFTTAPVAVKQGDGRTHLNIVCYAHPMFDGIKDAGEHIFKDNDATGQIVYEMLTGTGYESSKGIQGFEIAAAENFVTIGMIHYNASVLENNPSTGMATWTGGTDEKGKPNDRILVAAVERQANPEARMVMLAVNCGAQSKFTETGRTIVHKCLQYLLSDYTITPMADCSFTFDNGAGALHDAAWYKDEKNCPGCTGTLGDGKWSTAANWAPDRLTPPGKDTEVKIAAPVEVDMTHAIARSARIVEGGHITIPAGKALEIVGTIRRLDGTEISPTENSDITIGSSDAGNGSLIFNNDKGDSKARVLMYSNAPADVANMSAATSTWQYIGTPHTDVTNARSNYYGSWLYQYSGSGWDVIPNGGPLVPFHGYCITNETAPIVYDMEGTLAATTTQDIAIPAGYTVIANSWTAPIDISTFTDDDMENISDKTIYFFNTGTDVDGNHGTGTEPGTYVAVPKNSASYIGTWQIPSMQGFYISTETAGTLHLDYDRHVRPTGGRTIVSNPMYAPRRAKAAEEEPAVLKIFARGSRYQDKLVVLEREDFTRGYDSGWDGEAWGGGTLSPMVYVTGEGREDAVSAIPEFEGTVVAFKAGEDSEYRFEFIYSEDAEPLYLFDTENNTYTQIMTGNAYYFTTSDKAPHSRFILTRKAPQITTGTELTSDGESAKARKLLIEDKMYILLNGMLYDATGKVVK